MRITSRIRFATAVVACLSLANVTIAESLFQRLPEPGQWCRYDILLFGTVEESAVNLPEQHGGLIVSALDIVEHNGVPHQWIEITSLIEVPTADAVHTTTYKCLIRRDQLQAGGDPLAHIARGWLKLPGSESAESNVTSFTAEGEEALALRYVMSEPLANPTKVTVPNSARIGDEEFETSEGVTGTLETIEIGEDLELDGEFSYWTHDAAGFGVLASEFVLNTRRSFSPNTILIVQIAAQLEIEDQGDGAVSKLPDHE